MRRLDWLIAFGLFLVLLTAVILGIFFWQQSRLNLELTPVPNVPLVANSSAVATGETALLAFGRSQNRALAWQADAVLIAGEATWPFVDTMDILLQGREDWNFTFYSAAQQAAVGATVVDKNPSLGDPYPVADVLQPLGIEGWQVDSDAAVRIFLANGGTQFFQSESYVTFFMQLSMVANNNGRIEWLLAAVSQQTGHSLTLRIDATSGEILEVQQG